MARFVKYVLAPLVACLLIHAAAAQDFDITGAWSWQTPTPQGPQQLTLLLQPDGGFTKVLRLPNGTLLRFWGHYRQQATGPDQVRLELHFEGMRPRTNCVAIPGFGQRCQPWPTPQDGATLFTISSAGTMQAEGSTLFRDRQAALLQMFVPDPSVIAGQAPVVPQMAQPVAPPRTGYQTPYDPRKQYEKANRSFEKGYMEGCTQAPNGQWYACQQ